MEGSLKNRGIPENDTRSYGIDILKIISIFMVVVLHVLGRGGALAASEKGSLQYYIVWLAEIAAFGAVNCFAMATGYLMIDKSYKSSRIIGLWLQVSAITLVLTLAMTVIFPQQASLKFWIRSVFPVGSGMYWYFSAYFGLFFLMPFINKVFEGLSGRKAFLLCAALLLFFSALDTVSMANVFDTDAGYSCVWLGVMYCIGGSIKKYKIARNKSKWWFLGLYAACTAVTFVYYIINNSAASPLSVNLVAYNSPTVVVASVGLVIFCSKIKIKRRLLGKIIAFVSPLSFGVYIIHQHALIWNSFMANRFAFLANLRGRYLVFVILAIAIGVYLCCAVAEWLRSLVFKLLRINRLSSFLGDKIDSIMLK